MEEVLKMSPKERERKAIFEMVKRGCLMLKQAARQSHLSYRQTRRAFQAYLKLGAAVKRAYIFCVDRSSHLQFY